MKITIIILSISLLIGLSIGYILGITRENEPVNPLRYSSPQQVVTQGPFHPGDEFEVFRIKCNDSDKDIGILLISSDWRPVAQGLQGTPYRQGIMPLYIGAHECNENKGKNQIPATLLPGKYTLEGLDCIVDSYDTINQKYLTSKQCQAWKTETFEIVK